jgi:hypothetical protein
MADQATQLVVITPPPTNVTAGVGFGLTVAAEDPFGNVDSSFAQTVSLTLASNPGGATLGGTTTVALSNGLANFTKLTVSSAGSSYTLTAAGSGPTPPTAASVSFNATSGATGTGGSSTGSTGTGGSSTGSTGSSGSSSGSAAPGSATSDPAFHLAFDVVPDTVALGHYFKLTVRVADARGAIDTGYTGTVTLALASNPRGAMLGGNLTMPVIRGQMAWVRTPVGVLGRKARKTSHVRYPIGLTPRRWKPVHADRPFQRMP